VEFIEQDIGIHFWLYGRTGFQAMEQCQSLRQKELKGVVYPGSVSGEEN
jgi:hypothetical protein